jgi:hypothetical protein
MSVWGGLEERQSIIVLFVLPLGLLETKGQSRCRLTLLEAQK